MTTILTAFLADNLLQIGDDDDKLLLLEQAAAALAAEISESPILAYRFAMVGFDDRIPPSDPVHVKAAEALATQWKTMVNKTGAGPVQIYRAILLRSIELACETDSEIQMAVVVISRQPGSQFSLSKASAGVARLVNAWESSLDDDLDVDWVDPVALSMPSIADLSKKLSLSKDQIALAINRACGPTDKDGKALASANPHWPNEGQPWAVQFASRATDAIHAAIQGAIKSSAEEIKESLRDDLQSWATSLNRLAMRDAKSELLWLMTSQFSPAAGRGFRTMKPAEVALYAAVDVARAVNKFAPESVDYFIREIVSTHSQERVKLVSAFDDIRKAWEALPECSSIVGAEVLPASGRRSLLDFVSRGGSKETIEQQLGFDDQYELSYSEFAVCVFRELQIRKLLMAPQ